MMTRTPLALLCVLAAIACSSKHGGDFGSADASDDVGNGSRDAARDGGTGVTVASYCASLTAAQATLAAECLGGTAAAWTASIEAVAPCSKLEAAVDAGRVAFAVSDTAACLTAYAALPCSSFSTPDAKPAACTSALLGKVAKGGTCYSSIDCASDSFCSGLGGSTNSCAGTCKPKTAAGATCAAGDECVSGYTCTSGTCTATATLGALGATCDYDATTKKVAPACATGLACDLKTFTCVTAVKVGATCPPGHSVCGAFSACDPTTEKCVANPGLGGKCGHAAGEDDIACVGQTFCKPSGETVDGTCVALGGEGAPCEKTKLTTAGGQCLSGVCSGETDAGPGTCTAPCENE